MKTVVRKLRLAPQITVDRFEKIVQKPGHYGTKRGVVEAAITHALEHYSALSELHLPFIVSPAWKDWCDERKNSTDKKCYDRDFGNVRLDAALADRFDKWTGHGAKNGFPIQAVLFAYLRDVEQLYPQPEPEPQPSRHMKRFKRRVEFAMDRLCEVPMDDRPLIGEIEEMLTGILDDMKDRALKSMRAAKDRREARLSGGDDEKAVA